MNAKLDSPLLFTISAIKITDCIIYVCMYVQYFYVHSYYFLCQTLDEWSFNVFALSEAANGHPIRYLGYDILNRYGILHKFKVSATTLEAFLSKVEEGYKKFNNPYHNNLHGADVAQTVHHILCQTGLMVSIIDLAVTNWS